MHQLIVYCDESAKRGKYFSNFFGGALLRASDREKIETTLDAAKIELNLGKELKWTRITENYVDKYIDFIGKFFVLVQNGTIKIRVMFTQSRIVPAGLTDDHIANEYFLLYYQFLKHAFGLQYADIYGCEIATYLDQLPHNTEKNERFKDYIASLSKFTPFRSKNIAFPRDRIADVNSQSHVILQGLDIILGAMQFRSNDLHLETPPNSRIRGKRTRAKDKAFKYISTRIRDIHPNFNIGVSTGRPSGHADRWTHPYRHWLFTPSEAELDVKAPVKKRRAPQPPT